MKCPCQWRCCEEVKSKQETKLPFEWDIIDGDGVVLLNAQVHDVMIDCKSMIIWRGGSPWANADRAQTLIIFRLAV